MRMRLAISLGATSALGTTSALGAALALGATLAIGAPRALAAQDASSAPWAFLYGCWVAETEQGSTALPAVTCVLPVAGDAAAVELVTLKDGQMERRASLFADGREMPIEETGCTGREVGRPSDDGRRVYVEGSFDCGDGVRRNTSTVMALGPSGDWIEVQAVRTGNRTAVRSLRSSRLALDDLTEPLRSALAPFETAALAARKHASRVPSSADVIEMSQRLEPVAVETWLAAAIVPTEYALVAKRRELERLQAAGIPASTIDMVVALGNREHFQVSLAAEGASAVSNADVMAEMRRSAAAVAEASNAAYGSRTATAWSGGACDRLLWDVRRAWPIYGMPFYSPVTGLMINPVNCLDSHAFWGGYLWGRSMRYGTWGYGYANQPVTVTVTPRYDRGGRMEKGRGYVPASGTTPRGSAQPRGGDAASSRPRSPATESRPASSSGTSRSGSSGSSSSGSSSSGGKRTAQPRKP